MSISEARITLLLPNKLKNRLQKAARKRGLPTLGLIRLALSEWLEQAELKERLEKEPKKKKG